MIDCALVLAHLWEYLDGEMEPDDVEVFRAHLELCRRCYPAYRFDRAYLELVARQGAAGGAPPHLSDRVRAALSNN